MCDFNVLLNGFVFHVSFRIGDLSFSLCMTLSARGMTPNDRPSKTGPRLGGWLTGDGQSFLMFPVYSA